jgi:dolichol kinase
MPDPFGILRKHEKRTATGMLYFILSAIVVFAVFDFKIALVALLLTVFGDMASSMIGIQYGKHRLRSGKSLEGFIGGLCANFLVAGIFLWEYPLIMIAMILTASIAEMFSSKLDDNLTVPISSAFVGHTIAYILGVNLVQLTNPIQDLYHFFSNFF